MPPKKKASEVAAPSTSIPPPPEQTGGGVDAGGGTGADEGAHDAARSKDKAAQTSASLHAPRPSQEARDRQRHGTRGTIRSLGQGQAGGSRTLKISMHVNMLALGSVRWNCYALARHAPTVVDVKHVAHFARLPLTVPFTHPHSYSHCPRRPRCRCRRQGR